MLHQDLFNTTSIEPSTARAATVTSLSHYGIFSHPTLLHCPASAPIPPVYTGVGSIPVSYGSPQCLSGSYHGGERCHGLISIRLIPQYCDKYVEQDNKYADVW
jgi:hypothetical protein